MHQRKLWFMPRAKIQMTNLFRVITGDFLKYCLDLILREFQSWSDENFELVDGQMRLRYVYFFVGFIFLAVV